MKIKMKSKKKPDIEPYNRQVIQVRFSPLSDEDTLLYEKVKWMAEEKAINMSGLVRAALRFYFDNNRGTLLTE